MSHKIPNKYGMEWPPELTPFDIELYGFGVGGLGGRTPYYHLSNVINRLWPKMDRHEWMQQRFQNLCRYDINAWVGCATSGKTFDAGLFALCWWLPFPDRSSVVLTSTTGKSIRRRIWPVIQELFSSAERVDGSPICGLGFPGNMVDSRTTLQCQKGDDKHCIVAIAVADGPVQKAVSDIKGYHPRERMLVIVDELNDTPEAILHAVSNLRKGLQEFKMILIGNPVSRHDPHGICCEPELGWNSITVESEEWPTKGVNKWEIQPGICLRFDGEKSPNIKAGHKKYPFLISRDDVESAKKANEGEDTIGYWSHTRGFWPPEGVCKTVFSDALVEKYDGRGQHIFLSGVRTIAGLDPSFTAAGDGCILRFGLLGDLPDKRLAVQLTDRVKIPIKSGDDIYYQIAAATIRECKRRGMTPEELGIDVTGGGKGVADIIVREWGSGVHRIEFGSKASDKRVSLQDNRLAHEVYCDMVTELWYDCREFLVAGQLKGLDENTITEFCNREYTVKGGRIQVLPKMEVKKLIGRSPDDADAVVGLMDVAKKLGARYGTQNDHRPDKKWADKAKEFSKVYEPEETERPESEIEKQHNDYEILQGL